MELHKDAHRVINEYSSITSKSNEHKPSTVCTIFFLKKKKIKKKQKKNKEKKKRIFNCMNRLFNLMILRGENISITTNYTILILNGINVLICVTDIVRVCEIC